jgi:hypothetical protein
MLVIPIDHEGLQMSAVLIDFDEITESDVILTVRKNEDVTITIEGEAQYQDSDGDWLCGDELLTYHDSAYDEEYYLIKSGSLPEDAGTIVTFPNHRDETVYALKLYGDDGWFANFPDGSSAVFDDLYIARKDWTVEY